MEIKKSNVLFSRMDEKGNGLGDLYVTRLAGGEYFQIIFDGDSYVPPS